MRPLYIFDLDGTLANIDHRLHFLDGKKDGARWRKFYAACVDDEVIQPVADIFSALGRTNCDIWIWTGRSAGVKAETEVWLERNLDFPLDGIELAMREVGDHRPDYIMKAEWLGDLDEYDRRRLVVFEDRSRVVKMYSDAGVTCFQVAEGEF